jgi:protocatechuate 3,4-dioxygenase beta subunit
MKILRFALPLLMAGAASAVQSPAVSLQGLVLESGSNNPISNATLELVATAGVASGRALAVSSNDGVFAFRGLRPGQYSLTATRPGYLRAQYGQYGPNSPASMITISGQGVVNVRLPLLKSASISGHVYDESGAPAVNAQLHAWRISYKDGWRLPVPVASQMTNDLGEYRLFGLPPGEYYVSAQVDPLIHIRSPASISIAAVAPGAAILNPGPGMFSAILDPAFPRPEPRVEMAPVYYGGTINEYAATALHIRPGSDLKAIEIVAKRIPAVSVTGVVLGVDSKPYVLPGTGARATGTPTVITGPNGERIQVLLNGAAPGGASVVVTPAVNQEFLATPVITVLGGVLTVAPLTPVQTNGMGQFRTGVISPGDYLLTAIANEPQGQHFFAQTSVNVQGASPSNLTLSLEPSWEMQGRINLEGFAANATPDLTKLSVRATSTISALADALPSAPTASGMLTLKNMTSGNYVVTVPPVSSLFASVAPAPAWQNAYIKSIRLGSIDVLESGLRLVSPPTTPLEIVISGRGGSLRGVVRDGNRATLPNVTVVLIPEESNRHRKDLFRSALSDSTGGYHIEGLAPGNYKLFAWQDVESQMWHDPAFMRVYEDLGRAVVVAEASSQVVDLAGISPLDR